MIQSGPASPAAARLNASVLVEPASSSISLRNASGGREGSVNASILGTGRVGEVQTQRL